jgi:glycosyltransferase involved in cell wall biosynthesis
VSDQVRFLGYQSDPRAILASHRLYCHSATIDNFPIALVEAMAEGLPVLAGAVGGIPELVRAGLDGETWPLDDPQAGADRLVALMSDPARLRTMADSARNRAQTEFSSEVQVPRLVDFLTTAERRH